MSSAEAAKILGVSTSMFNRISRNSGPQPHKKVGNERLYRASDIMILKQLREGDVGLHNLIIEARRSVIEARALRHEVDQLKYALRVNIPAIPLDKESVLSVLFKAEDDLSKTKQMTKEELLEWAHTLHGIHEPFLKAAALYMDTKEPWRGILNLARKLCAEQPMEYTRVDKELENIYGLLNSGLRLSRQAAYFYVREQNGKIFADKMFPEAKNSPHEEVLMLSFTY